MTHWYESKIGKIIDKELDARLEGLVISQIVSMGWNAAEAITDEEIEAVSGNGILTKETMQALFRTCRRICKECTLYDDFFPYIRKYLGMQTCKVHDITLYQDDYQSDQWDEILYKLDLDGEEMDAVDVIAIVD